ncbi:conserved hypothetical protein [Vibrio chagasii]|nr:hypothetical protein AOG25_07995 [Vibrio alginolyticus]CAH7130900.1 conserved hypothetical protein [Vibrio chagasii]CAH7222259.1 conserved hypothetical protein [Vibrio chagasii]
MQVTAYQSIRANLERASHFFSLSPFLDQATKDLNYRPCTSEVSNSIGEIRNMNFVAFRRAIGLPKTNSLTTYIVHELSESVSVS